MDLRKPKLLEYFNIDGKGKGITHYLSDTNISISDMIYHSPGNQENIDLIESGIIPPNPAELLLKSRLAEFYSEIKSKYDYVVVDTAPVNLVTDTLIINDYVDMFVYVTRSNYLDKRLLVVPQNLHDQKRLNNMAILINVLINRAMVMVMVMAMAMAMATEITIPKKRSLNGIYLDRKHISYFVLLIKSKSIM